MSRREMSEVEMAMEDLVNVVNNAFITPDTSPFCSPNRFDVNGEAANVTDGLFAIADALNRLAKAVEGKQ